MWAGCLSIKEVKDLYAASFSDGKGMKRMGAITPMHVSEFKKWLAAGDTTKPFSESAC